MVQSYKYLIGCFDPRVLHLQTMGYVYTPEI